MVWPTTTICHCSFRQKIHENCEVDILLLYYTVYFLLFRFKATIYLFSILIMKRFVLNSAIFLAIFSTLAFVIININISDNYIIEKTRGTNYNKIAWNLNLINNHPDRIKGSVIFLGPSIVQGGICDSTISSLGIKSLNLGVNHVGNEVNLFFLKKVLKRSPKKVFIHLYKERVVNLHPMTPLLYSPIDLLRNGQSINIPFASYCFQRLPFVLRFLIWNRSEHSNSKEKYSKYGIEYESGELSNKSYQELKSGSKFLKKVKNIYHFVSVNASFVFNTTSQQLFMEEAFKSAQSYGVDFSELYIPDVADARSDRDFDSAFNSPRNIYHLESLKNFSFFDRGAYWYDFHHLSKKGAILFSHELINQKVVN